MSRWGLRWGLRLVARLVARLAARLVVLLVARSVVLLVARSGGPVGGPVGGQVPPTGKRRYAPLVVLGGVAIGLAIPVILFVIGMVAGIIHDATESSDQSSSGSSGSLSATPATKLTQDQLYKDTAKEGALHIEGGKPIKLGGTNAVYLDPYSNLVEYDSDLYLLQGDTLKPVSAGCTDCYIYGLEHGIAVFDSLSSNKKVFIWNFNTDKQINVDATDTGEVSIWGRDLVVVETKAGEVTTYDGNGKQLIKQKITNHLLSDGYGDWGFTSGSGTAIAINLRTGQKVEMPGGFQVIWKDGMANQNTSSDDSKVYDTNMKETGKRIPVTCWSYNVSKQATTQAIVDSLSKYAINPSEYISKCRNHDFEESIEVSTHGKLAFVRRDSKEMYMDSPDGKAYELSDDSMVTNLGDYLMAMSVDNDTMAIYRFGEAKPIFEGKVTASNRQPKQLNHLIVEDNDKLKVIK